MCTGFQLERTGFSSQTNYYVAEVRGLRRTLHQPTKHAANPVIGGDKPWEANYVVLGGTVLRDSVDGLFKAWYKSYEYGEGTWKARRVG